MKKLILYSALLLLSLFAWNQYRLDKKRYLKEETYLKHLDRSLFISKCNHPSPDWVNEQIDEDFQNFESIPIENVDATFIQILKTLPTPFHVRYRIIDNELYRYFRPSEKISLKDTSTELAIKTILQCTSLPNIDCIISFYDGVRPNHTYFHTTNRNLQAPLLISAKIVDTPYCVLIPDYRSIGHWWFSDIKHVKSRMDRFPWEKKRDFAIWRGGCNRKERIELCRLSKQFPQYLDAKFSLPSENPLIEEEGLMGQFVSWDALLECKFLPMVDGYMTAAPALQWRLLSNSLAFKPDSNEIQWFYRALSPFVHYVPVRQDLSDLIEKLDWAKNHDDASKQIAMDATDFALNNLMYEDVLCYFTKVLKRYGSLQKLPSKKIKSAMQTDPRWVNIQYRKKLRQRAKKLHMVGYTEDPTPGTSIINASLTSTTP